MDGLLTVADCDMGGGEVGVPFLGFQWRSSLCSSLGGVRCKVLLAEYRLFLCRLI